MYKIQTKILNFRFNGTIWIEPLLVTWFKLDSFNHGTCFSKEELFAFSRYIKTKPNNFTDPLYFDCFKLSANFNFNRIILDTSIHMPKLLVLTEKPKLYKTGELYECMEITLIDIDKNNDHNYSLKFDVLGQVEC